MKVPVGVHVEFGFVNGFKHHLVLNDTWFCEPTHKPPSWFTKGYSRLTVAQFLEHPCDKCLRMLDGDPA
jgi:hypothetical protein